MDRYISLVLSLFVFVFLPACTQTATSTPPPSPTASQVVSTPAPSVAPLPTAEVDPIQVQLDAMTTEEKVGQLLTVGFEGTTTNEAVATYLADYHVGGFILFGRNIETVEQVVTLTNDLKSQNPSRIPLFLGVDQEGGLVDRMPKELPRTPTALSIGETQDPDLVTAYGKVLGLTCASLGFNIDFAPSVDVWSNPNNTVIGKRALGTDFAAVAALAPYAVQGVASQGVLPVIKHFPGHGDTDVDSHTALPIVHKDADQLWEEELRPFRAVLEGDTTTGVMVSHLLLPQLDDHLPASLSPAIVTGLLREDMGFDGLVVTDDMTMGAITNDYDLPTACLLSIQAGCDQLLVCHGSDSVAAVYNHLLRAVTAGDLTSARLDESVYRILTAKAALTDDEIETPDPNQLAQAIISLR